MNNEIKNIALCITENQATTLGLHSEYNAIQWLQTIPQLNIIGNVVPFIIRKNSNDDLELSTWTSLTSLLKKEWEHFSGFVVLYNSDNIEYAACALSYCIQQQNKPIIFTGIYKEHEEQFQHSTHFKTIGTYANIMNACHIATLNIAETALLFGNTLIKAIHAERLHENTLNLFKNAHQQQNILGKIEFSISLAETRKKRKPHAHPIITTKLHPHVVSINLHPGITEQHISSIIQSTTKAIIVISPSTHIMTRSQQLLLKKYEQQGILITIYKTTTNPEYSPPFTIVQNITFASLLTKCMWILSQTSQPKKQQELLQKNIIGEFLSSKQSL